MVEIDLSKCPICSFPGAYYTANPGNDTYNFNCQQCKSFIVSKEVLLFRDIKEKITQNADRLSGLARLLSETGGKTLQIFITTIDEILKDNLIPDREDIQRKSELLLSAIRRRTKFYGHVVHINLSNDYPLAFAANTDELIALLTFLKDNKLIIAPIGRDQVQLTAEGWMSFQKKSAESKQGFIAAWFPDDRSMDEVIKYTENAISECGYKPMCIKEEHYAETILEKAIGEIVRSKFVVVNLTGSRTSVFYEAGFAQGIGIDVIYVCDKNQETKDFYPKHYKIYFYENPAQLKEILIDAIRARLK